MFIVYRGVDYKGYFVIYDSEGRLIKSEEIFSDTVGNHKIIPTTLLNGNVFILYRAADYDTYFVIFA